MWNLHFDFINYNPIKLIGVRTQPSTKINNNEHKSKSSNGDRSSYLGVWEEMCTFPFFYSTRHTFFVSRKYESYHRNPSDHFGSTWKPTIISRVYILRDFTECNWIYRRSRFSLSARPSIPRNTYKAWYNPLTKSAALAWINNLIILKEKNGRWHMR